MLQSSLFTSTLKDISSKERSVNARLLAKAGFVSKVSSGIYAFLPMGWRVFKKIEQLIRKEMNELGGQEIFLPALHPRSYWDKTGRWKTYEDIYRLESEGKHFALGATHEEIVVPVVKKAVSSYNSFPFSVYQIQTKFRKEKRAKSGLLRGREFVMKDLYSFHTNEKCLDEFYEKTKDAYRNIFDKCGIGKETIVAFASGGAFSKYSHEFQTVTPAGEDIIYFCSKCNLGINSEIIDKQKVCPKCKKKNFKKLKAIEVGNIFKLKDKFSKPFNYLFKDKDNIQKPILMGCYGIGLNRLVGTIAEVNNDKNGLVWPAATAPFLFHIVPLASKDKKVQRSLFQKAENIYAEINEKWPEEALLDDREVRSGEKLVESDLIGIPWRIVVSERNMAKGMIEVKERSKKNSTLVKEKEILSFLEKKVMI